MNLKRIIFPMIIAGNIILGGCEKNKYNKLERFIQKEGNLIIFNKKDENILVAKGIIRERDIYISIINGKNSEAFYDAEINGLDIYIPKNEFIDNKKLNNISKRYDSIVKNIPKWYNQHKK